MHKNKGLSDSGFSFRGASEAAVATAVGKAPVKDETFDETLKRFWFDTCLHNQKSLDLLFDVVGPDRCVFGTERPGSGSGKDPVTKQPYDDLKPTIEGISWLTDDMKAGIFEKNAQRLFPLFTV
jgi:4-oxalmesaconate hydratase